MRNTSSANGYGLAVTLAARKPVHLAPRHRLSSTHQAERPLQPETERKRHPPAMATVSMYARPKRAAGLGIGSGALQPANRLKSPSSPEF